MFKNKHFILSILRNYLFYHLHVNGTFEKCGYFTMCQICQCILNNESMATLRMNTLHYIRTSNYLKKYLHNIKKILIYVHE